MMHLLEWIWFDLLYYAPTWWVLTTLAIREVLKRV